MSKQIASTQIWDAQCDICQSTCSDLLVDLGTNLVALSLRDSCIGDSCCVQCCAFICRSCTEQIHQVKMITCPLCESMISDQIKERESLLKAVTDNIVEFREMTERAINGVASEHEKITIDIKLTLLIISWNRDMKYMSSLIPSVSCLVTETAQVIKNMYQQCNSPSVDLSTHCVYKSIQGPAHEHSTLFTRQTQQI